MRKNSNKLQALQSIAAGRHDVSSNRETTSQQAGSSTPTPAARPLQSTAGLELKQSGELKKLHRCLEVALNNMGRGLSMFDAEARLIVCNKLYREIYALPERLTRPGTPLAEVVCYHVKRETGRDGPGEIRKQRKWIKNHVAQLAQGKSFSHVQALKSGRIILVSNQPLAGGGWVDIQEDITEKRQAEQKIDWLARHDPMTKLANRYQFREQLKNWSCPQKGGGSFALHWIDLNRFKDVNDNLGHPVGDVLLKSVAKRLGKAVRASDLVARVGGDEFAILQKGAGQTQAMKLAKRLISTLAQPYQVLGHNIVAGASIGIALAPKDGPDSKDLMRHADLALYSAKASGRCAYVFFSPEGMHTSLDRRDLKHDVQLAVSKGQLELYYQPIVDMKEGSVTALEALTRWHHPTRGMIDPSEFIFLTEESGFISEMGEWVLHQACSDAATWPDQIKVAVNISPTQIAKGNIYDIVEDALGKTGLDPCRLELEITETVLLRDEAKVHDVLHKLRDLGIQIALDDFGTGYASLSYLRSFPFSTIKIDRSFIRDLDGPQRKDCVAIINAVAGLAKQLQMGAVAEGVETLDHLETVSTAGCRVQGFYFSKPVPASEVQAVLLRLSTSLTSSVKKRAPAPSCARSWA